ncbi:hypothetical protein MSG28_014839 [Choristoneura fumiferana]|uniref:Uncharacterized protein n=1 Tax=Choristoneura fumiferana TaxID=7141 RepID=A0ACC0JST3_CHOFU|nr:hypothetical protein MSG28_014839 [Choristoneura fumiferana]
MSKMGGCSARINLRVHSVPEAEKSRSCCKCTCSRHIARSATGKLSDTSYICPVCCDTFTRPGNVRQHLRAATACATLPARHRPVPGQCSVPGQGGAAATRPAAIAGTGQWHGVTGRGGAAATAQPAIARYQVGAVQPRPAQPAIARYQVSARVYQVDAVQSRPAQPALPVPGRGVQPRPAQPAIAGTRSCTVYQVDAVQSRTAQYPSPGTRSVHSVPGRGGASIPGKCYSCIKCVHMTNVSEDKPPSAAPQTFV